MSDIKKRDLRFSVSIALFLLSVGAAVLISFAANRYTDVWVAARTIPAGSEVSKADIKKVPVSLSHSLSGYLTAKNELEGRISQRTIAAGEMIHVSAIASTEARPATSELSFSIRASDIASDSRIGSYVTIFQVQDVRPGEQEQPPVEVVHKAFIKEINRKSSSLNSDLIISVVISQNDVPLVLQSTTSGRLVLVGSTN